MASAQCRSPFLLLNNNVSATSYPFCSSNLMATNPFTTFVNHSSNYQQMRIGLKQVHALLLLAFLLQPQAAFGNRFVIDKEECFSYNVKYKENSDHVSFVMVKTDSACPYTENGAGHASAANVKGDRKRKREETNVQKEEMEREIKELREQIQKASQRIDKLSKDLSLLDTNTGMEVNGDEEQMQQASQHTSKLSHDHSWSHTTTRMQVNGHKEPPSKTMRRSVSTGY